MGIDEKTSQGKGQQSPKTAQGTTGSTQEKFVPTCSICGEKHWPHHPLVPCVNKKRAKAKAKADRKAKAKAAAKAKAEAQAEARAQRRAYIEAVAKAEARLSAESKGSFAGPALIK